MLKTNEAEICTGIFLYNIEPRASNLTVNGVELYAVSKHV